MGNFMKYLTNVVTLQYFPEKCTGCKRCVEVCPRGVFKIKDKKASIVDKDLCIECGACKNNCEYGAIAVEDGVGCAVAIAYSMLTGKEPQCGCTDSGDKACC